MDKDTKRRLGGAALAAGGLGAAAGVPGVARAELKIAAHRTRKIDRQLSAVKAAMPKKPDPSTRYHGGRYHPEPTKNKVLRGQEAKKVTGQISELERKRNAVNKPKVYRHQTKLWGAGLGVGLPTSYLGAKQAVEKKQSDRQRDVNAAYAGGAGGFLGYQGGSLALKPLEKPAERKIKADPELRRKLAAHREKVLPSNPQPGHPAWHKFNADYPKSLPGARMKRVNARMVSGRTGAAATLAVTGASAAGAVGLDRMKRKKVSKSMSISAFGIDHGVVSKLDYGEGKKPSTGRQVLASAPYTSLAHPFVAGKKGKKLRSGGNQIGGGVLGGVGGSTVGSLAATAVTRGRSPGAVHAGSAAGGIGGGIYGSQRGLARNTRKGYLKDEKGKD